MLFFELNSYFIKIVITFSNILYRINVQNVKDKDKIFPPLLIIEYGELTFEQIDKTLEITLDYTVKFTLVDNNIHLYLEVNKIIIIKGKEKYFKHYFKYL